MRSPVPHGPETRLASLVRPVLQAPLRGARMYYPKGTRRDAKLKVYSSENCTVGTVSIFIDFSHLDL